MPFADAAFGAGPAADERDDTSPLDDAAPVVAVSAKNPEPADGGLELSLEPLEEPAEATPVAAVGAATPRLFEHRLEQPARSATAIRHVWLLCASIGGAEAVRQFLAALPAGFPALFVLVQRVNEDYLHEFQQQLAQATPLRVVLGAQGTRVGGGDVVLAPGGVRLCIDRSGLVGHEEDIDHVFSIDAALCDTVDLFGADAGAILFSGNCENPLDALAYFVAKGGTVFAQDPETCVISSMIDIARNAGLVNFVAAPAQLAQHLVDRRRAAAD
jgi:two-component system chemotaxis response regulator CheB/chemosensory pili system protein ChpB (putative protein-glutamate methylesterase)